MKNLNHSTRKHSRIGASSSHRWLNCKGSVALCELAPKPPSSDAADKGTFVHELSEKCLLSGKDPRDYIGKTWGAKKYVVDEEAIAGAKLYVNYVRETLRKYPDSILHVEKKFHLPHIHPDLYGSSDAVIETDALKLIVVDYKNGIGVVEVEDNSQLKIYALGAAYKGDYEMIELVVVQPHANHPDGPIRSWEIPYHDLVEWGETLKKEIAETEKPNAELNPGEWCQYCNGRPICSAMKKLSTEIARTDFDDDIGPVLPEVEALTNEQIARVLEHRKTIEAWFKSIKDYALQKIVAGEHIEGLKLVQGKGSRHWDNEEFVKKSFGEAVLTPPKLMSVSQAEKVLGTKSVKGLWTKYEGSITVAHASDKRKALSNAKDDFTNIEWENVENED